VKAESSVVVDSIAPNIIPEVVDDEADDVFVEEDGRGVRARDGEDGKLVKDIMAAVQQMGPDKKGDFRGDSDRFKQEIEIARGLLQHLSISAQPLDTLIQFSQEDLGNMENEYKRWTAECDRKKLALEQERLQTEQQHQELNNKLEELNKEIERQQAKLRMMKAAAFLKEAELMKQFASLCT
jgi:chromosome segregation ATPase